VAAVAAAFVVIAACGGFTSSTTLTPALGTHTPTPTPAGPTATAVAPEDATYLVQPGDTLAEIAAMFNVTVGELMSANSISDPTALQSGQLLRIPGVAATPSPTPPPGSSPSPTATSTAQVTLLQLVDKQHPLPDGYAPPDLVPVTGNYLAPGYSASMRSDALAALVQLLDAAAVAGYDIRVVSGYRSYDDQIATYQYWVNQLGETEANRVSAKPGYSEHQLGSAADLGTADFGWDLTSGFGATPAGKWLAANSTTYGFVLSFPDGKEDITGYAYEPWHFRYIGVDEAQQWKASGQTLNQFLGA
jgi:D-alanyl-D-alanine carboxypeptidase